MDGALGLSCGPCHPAAAGAQSAAGDALAGALDLARALADRLARVPEPAGDPDALRLARALALNVVDLLAEACAASPPAARRNSAEPATRSPIR